MEVNQSNQQSYNERRGLALAGMIIGLVGFLCAFIHGWRMFATGISFVALIVSVISLQKAVKHRKQKTRQIVGLISSLAAIAIAGYFLYTGPDEKGVFEGDQMPVNVHDDGVPGSKDENAKQLKGAIDSASSE